MLFSWYLVAAFDLSLKFFIFDSQRQLTRRLRSRPPSAMVLHWNLISVFFPEELSR